MKRRDFLQSALVASAATPFLVESARTLAQETTADPTEASVESKPLLNGSPVVTGPSHEATTILQAVNRPATGFVEIRLEGGEWKKIDAETSDYYVLGYYSTNPDPTRKRRSLEVKVSRPGVSVWARRGYALKTPDDNKK